MCTCAEGYAGDGITCVPEATPEPEPASTGAPEPEEPKVPDYPEVRTGDNPYR